MGNFLQSTLVRFFIFIINCYKKIPLKPVCRFVPSCSEYALISLKKSGIKAVFKIIFRILRCNPFSKRKVDL